MKLPRSSVLPAAASALVACVLAASSASALAKASPVAPAAHPSAVHVVTFSRDAHRLVDWVKQTSDNKGAPFAVIDKRYARLLVFTPDGRLRGTAPILLGTARGDDTAPGVGSKKLSELKPEELTTPAGRFVAEQGENTRGENVIWIDYDAAVSMHRVLTTVPKEHRLRRLATPTIADNRISHGCVNVPKAFFENVLMKTLNVPHPIVYVLPETRPLEAQFAGLAGASRSPMARQTSVAAARK
jgi:hypothetical protein